MNADHVSDEGKTKSTQQNWAVPRLVLQRQPAWLERHHRAVECAGKLKSAYKELLAILIEIDEHQVYFQLEKISLHAYCVEALELPTHTAFDFIDVIRTSKVVPELAQAILAGRTTISKARRVCSVITPHNQKEWIDLVSECSHKIVQRAVATANPRAAAPESLKYLSSDVLELKFAVSENWSELLTDVKDLMSQKESRNVTTEEALFVLMAEYKLKNDPVLKAERAQSRKQRRSTAVVALAGPNSESSKENKVSERVNSKATRVARYRPMSVEHQVELRDRNRCVYVDARGVQCESRRWLDKHHITEFSNGGEHTLENLETLCSAHHRMKHRYSRS